MSCVNDQVSPFKINEAVSTVENTHAPLAVPN